MELRPALRHFPVYIAIVLIFFGLKPDGLIFRDAVANGLPFIYFGFISILAGAFFTPLLLPYIPFKAFSVKGWIVGAVSVYLSMRLFGVLADRDTTLLIITYLFFPVVSSYMAVLFTGSTVFTGMSGVKKELKYAIPVYLSSAAVSVLLLIVFKLGQWRIL
jgi:acetyl-CoA decarbonylase/synthase complex subunit gamma